MKCATVFFICNIFYFISSAQNVGIGTDNPMYKLDVAGRVRLQYANSQTAGIWLDGTINSNIGFIGTINNNHIGLYGGVAGWQLAMNTDNGDVGIGVSAPTAKLDLNGDFRLRGNNATNGATLVSKDANGNSVWQRPYAFRAEGMPGYSDVTLPANGSGKVNFNSTVAFNIGLLYNPNTSIFTVPVKGIYDFYAHIDTYPGTNNIGASTIFQLIRVRNNVSTVLMESNNGHYVAGDVQALTHHLTHILAGDFLLEANDQVYVYVWNAFAQKYYGAAKNSSFSGHLVTQLF